MSRSNVVSCRKLFALVGLVALSQLSALRVAAAVDMPDANAPRARCARWRDASE